MSGRFRYGADTVNIQEQFLYLSFELAKDGCHSHGSCHPITVHSLSRARDHLQALHPVGAQLRVAAGLSESDEGDHELSMLRCCNATRLGRIYFQFGDYTLERRLTLHYLQQVSQEVANR